MYDHLGRPRNLGKPELPYREESPLEPDSLDILQEQIQKNKERVGEYVAAIDRMVNIERFPSTHERVRGLRDQMLLLMEENNTFRKTLWHHWLLIEAPDLNY